MNKSFIIVVLCWVAGISATAQTNFRHLTFDEAIAEAKQEAKLVFIDFYTDWCGPCKMMARDVFPQKKVGDYLNAKFVCIKLNAEKEGLEQAKRFEVKAYPTFLVLDTNEEVLLDIKGAMDADAFISKVESGLDPEWSPSSMESRFQAGERTPELVNRYVYSIMEQGKEKEGFKIIDDYFSSLTDSQRLDAANVFLYTRYTQSWYDIKAKFMVEHRDEFADILKHDISERINRLYHSAVVRYFSGYMFRENKFNEFDYDSLKKDVQYIDSKNAKSYAPMFRIIESRVKDNDETFWAVCKGEYDNLALNDRDLLVMNLTRLIITEDNGILKDMSQFIRSHLYEMSPTTIALAGRVLDGIESKLKTK